MPYVIKNADGNYVGKRRARSAKLETARIYSRRCDASNSMRHGTARFAAGGEIVEVTLKVKKPSAPRVKKIKIPDPSPAWHDSAY